MTDVLERAAVDQADRTARQVRFDTPRSAVHRVQRSTFSRNLGHIYETRCGDALSATAGALLTTRNANCPHCTPGWKAV